MAYKNREDQVAASRKHYQEHKKEYIERARARRRMLTEFINSFKNDPCKDCRHKFHPYAMLFVHRRGVKKENGTIYEMTHHQNFARDKIIRELSRCDLVCWNCFRIREHERELKQGIS